jgi:hypothetical protein
MMRDLFGIGRAYKKLPPHKNFVQLADNIERLADYLMDRSLGSIAREGYLKAPERWEWKLGNDLKMLSQYARDFAPPDTDGLHWASRKSNDSSPIR